MNATLEAKTDQKKKVYVLVIEDDKDMNDLICAALKSAGYSTASSYTGEDGIEVAMDVKPDLILLDIMLPKTDGVEVCRTLSGAADTKSIPVIMITAKKDISSKVSSYIAGAKRYITKPFGIDDLLNTIDKTIDNHSIFVDKVQQDDPELLQ